MFHNACFIFISLLYLKKIKTLSKTTGRIGLKGTNWSLVGLDHDSHTSLGIRLKLPLQWIAEKC